MNTISASLNGGLYDRISRGIPGVPELGRLVYWSFSETLVMRDNLAAAFQRAGLPQEWLPDERIPREAFIKAVREAANHHANGDRLLAEKMSDKDICEFHIGTLRKQALQTGKRRLRLNVVAGFALDKAARRLYTVTADGEETDAPSEGLAASLWAAVNEKYAVYLDGYNAADLQMLVLHIVKRRLEGVGLRENGGIYFVPRHHADMLERLLRAMDEISPQSKIFTGPVYDGNEWRRNAYAALLAEVGAELRRLAEDVANLADEKARTRASTFLKKIEEARRLSAQVDGYAALLGAERESFAPELREQVNEVIAAAQEAHAKASVTRRVRISK
jgi:hypothetical protein